MSQILVIGSTSNAGRALVETLSGTGEGVRAATRKPDAMETRSGGEPVRFAYQEPDTFEGALQGVDRAFVIAPPVPEPHSEMIPFLERAADDGRRKIVLMTAMGTEHDPDGSLRKVETALESSGAPYVILRPNWFMDNFHASWVTPIREAGVIPLPAADSRTSLIDARDIADCAAAALRTDRFDGQAFTLTGPEALTYAEAAAMLAKAAGREIRYVPVDDESFIRSMVAAGAPEDLSKYLAVLFSFVREGATAAVTGAVEEISGHAPRTLEQYAEDRAAAWR